VSHEVWRVELDKLTDETYRLMADDLLDELMKVRGGAVFDLSAYYQGSQFAENTPLGRVMARQQAIQMLLDHPLLVDTSAELYADTLHEGGSKYAQEVKRHGWLDGLGHSPKLDFLSEKLTDILGFAGTKILVFSMHPEMLEIIDQRMGLPAVQYHGRMSTLARAAAVNQFTSDPECRLFLSSHAGAYGTDMRMASHLINYDLPWSAGRADQINGRHQRAGSEFSKVFIADLIVGGTIEERKLDMLDYKRRISAAVVDGVVPKSGRIENDLVSLTQFLLDNQ
jgi:SNF2 family DNA or RNA helicase